MKSIHYFTILLLVITCFTTVASQPAPPDTLWSRVYGGSGHEQGFSVQQTTGGGYILGGYTDSFGSGDKDFWIIKTDASGDTSWCRTFGGGEEDLCRCVIETSSKGYLCAGFTESFGFGNSDGWLVMLDANGDSIWSECYGGDGDESFYKVMETAEGDFIVCGSASTYGSGALDGWLVKTDPAGDIIWTQCYGGGDNDIIKAMQFTSDSSFILTGYTESWGLADRNLWALRADSEGYEEWFQVYGGNYPDEGFVATETMDDGFMFMGLTYLTIPNPDVWLIKTDGGGNAIWSEHYGLYHYDIFWDGMQTEDEGYLGIGYCRPSISNWYYTNVMIMKTDSLGNEEWTLYYGGSEREMARSMDMTEDGGLIILGWTETYGSGGYDYWLLKTTPIEYLSEQIIQLTPYGTGIVIPPGGGNLYYNLKVINFAVSPVNLDVWVETVIPTGNERIILGPVMDITVPAEDTLTRDCTFFVPGFAPAGGYWVIGKIGEYGGDIIDTDYFSFDKAGSDGGSFSGSFIEIHDSLEVSDHDYQFNLIVSPNPFNVNTTISFSLPHATSVRLSVYDLLGREVSKLAGCQDGRLEAGRHSVVWDGEGVGSGVYFIRMEAGEFSQTRKLLLLK